MTGNSREDHLSTELDADLLSAPFKVETKWHVITGAACSGKSTLVDQMGALGFETVPEAAREYVETEKASGRSLAEIRGDRVAFTRLVYDLMLARERKLEAAEVAFLDRGVPDGLAYFRFAGLDPNGILEDCFRHRYAAVILLDRLPYRKDGVRMADDETATYFEMQMVKDYAALGYDVIRVPVLSPEERLAFVLERLAGKGLQNNWKE